MKKWLYVKSILVPIAVVTLLVGCAINQDNNSEEGVLVLGISDSALRARTVVPDVTMEIDTYDVWFYGPTNLGPPADPDFKVIDIPFGESRGVPLKPGLWFVEVKAINADDIEIASGETVPPIQITRGSIINRTIVVSPPEGPGSLFLYVSWPMDLLGDSPTVEANIVDAADPLDLPPVGNRSILMNSFSLPGADPEFQSSTKTLNDGYYLMQVGLKDTLGTTVWQTYEAIRILSGYQTDAIYDLVNSINQGLVDIGIGIDPDLQNPLLIGFEKDGVPLDDPEGDEIFETTLTQGDSAVITAIVTPTPDTYSWYWRGGLVTNGDSFTIDGSVEDPGVYWLDLIVQKDAIYSSARVVVTVVTIP
jgi:hypothetical protein